MTSTYLERIKLFNNKFSSLFPILLAVLLFGQIFFLIANYYFNISHPAWVLAFMLLVLLAARIFVARNAFQLTWLDICMISFFSLVITSLLMHSQYSNELFFKYYIGFMVIPFIAGRFLYIYELKSFILTILATTIIAAIAISLALLFMPAHEYNQDRISTLFSVYSMSFYGGVPGNIFAGFALAPLLILLHSPIFKINNSQIFSLLKILVIFWCVWLLLIIATRSAILSGLTFSIIAIIFFNSHNRSALIKQIATLASAVLFSFILLPDMRSDFILGSYNQLIRAVKHRDYVPPESIVPPTKYTEPSVVTPPLKEALPPVLQEQCVTGCNSVSARYYLYLDALEIFENNPILGIGANSYGMYLEGDSSSLASPHNLTLYIFMELGIVGGVLYVFMIGGVIFYFKRNTSHKEISGDKTKLHVIFMLWGFVLLSEQFSGNYFVTYQFYAMTGILISVYQQFFIIKKEHLINAQS